MADAIDPKRANIALGLAVARWKKLPDDSIAASLDDPSEWLQEATLMNHFLPAHLAQAGYSFIAVIPNEFSVGIKTVRQYAGLIYKHMVPMAALAGVAHASTLDIAEHATFKEAARLHGDSTRDTLASRSAKFLEVGHDFFTGGE